MLLLDIKTTVILWIVSMPTIFIYVNNFIKSVPIINADRVVFGAILVVLFLHIIFKKFKPLPLGKIEWCMIIFFIIITISAIFTGWPKDKAEIRQDAILVLQSFGMPFFAFFISKNLIQDKKSINRLLFGFTVVGCYLAIIGILQIYFGMSFFRPIYLEHNNLGRATGSFGNAAEYGAVLIIMAIYTIYQLFLYRDNKLKLLLLGASSLLMTLTVILSKTRAAWIALIISFYVIQKFDKNMKRVFYSMVVFVILGITVAGPYIFESDMIQRRLKASKPIYNRLILYGTTVKMIAYNPVIGIGFGRKSYQKAKPDYLVSIGNISPQWGAHVGVPHNEFLHIFVLTGIVGFIPYILIYIFALKETTALYRLLPKSSYDRKFIVYFWGVFSILITIALFSDIIFYKYLNILFYFLLGILSGQYTNLIIASNISIIKK